MPHKQRALTIADVAALVQRSAEGSGALEVFCEAERIAGASIGWRLFTIMRYVEDAHVVERLYSSDPEAYPIGGRKPLDKLSTSHAALESSDFFLAADRQAVRQAFFDHALIFSLGISAILNLPIRQAGRRLGTLNLCGEEGMYGPAEIADAKILAGLLLPWLLARRD